MLGKIRIRKLFNAIAMAISLGFFIPSVVMAKPEVIRPQTAVVTKAISLQQGDDAAFQLSDFFPEDVIDYQVQVLNDPHQVITAKVLNNIIYILVSPYDYKYAGISISPSYIVKVVAKRANNQLIIKQIQVNIKK